MADRRKIVIIDDEQDICFLVKETLEQTGEFEAVTVTNPLDALEACREQRPDLILLDIVMPKKKGSEIAEELKRDPLTKDIPVVIMSGLGEMVYFKSMNKWSWLPNRPIVRERGEVVAEKDPQKAAEAYGVDDYIEKPFTSEKLLGTIRAILKKDARS